LARVDKFAPYALRAGDIVIAMDRPFISTGLKVARLAAMDCPALLLQRVGRFHPSTAMSPAFLHYYLQGSTFSAHTGGLATGTQLPHISKTDIETCPILVPPINEQRRIVAKLDAIFEGTRATKLRLERLPALLDKLKRSILAAAFRGDLTADWRAANPDVELASALRDRIRTERRARWEAALRANGKDPSKVKYQQPEAVTGAFELPDRWCWASAAEVCELITNGDTPPRDRMSTAGEIPFIKIYNLTFTGEINWSKDPTYISRETHENELRRSRLRPGDVLMNIVGPPLGKVGIVPPTHEEWNTNQAVVAFRALPGLVPEFLRNCLMTWSVIGPLLETGKATVGQVNVALSDCRRLPVPLPPEVEQKEIVTRVRAALEAVQRLEERARGGTVSAQRLEQAALAKAFRGELVEQDPTDEPASALLDRLRNNVDVVQPRVARQPRSRAKRAPGVGQRQREPSAEE